MKEAEDMLMDKNSKFGWSVLSIQALSYVDVGKFLIRNLINSTHAIIPFEYCE